jgi:squalene-hopene/tetraprenyl-beta-curcumene cyclase
VTGPLSSPQTATGTLAAEPVVNALDETIRAASDALLRQQRSDGHWVFELEADATIPAEYVLLKHYLGEPIDPDQEAKIANYLRRIQGEHGGWPLFHAGAFNISASVKAYFALKIIGDDIASDHMQRARAAVLAHGGAANSNVFTRILLALFKQVPWSAVPVMPVEIMLLPTWFPFHLNKISYWARTVLVPLTVLMALKPAAKNPLQIGIAELFVTAPNKVRRWPKGPHRKWPWAQLFGAIDRVLWVVEPYFPRKTRRRAIQSALDFVKARHNGVDGLGAIFPAIAYCVMMYDGLNFRTDHPDYAQARQAIERLLVTTGDEIYCQPCVSPVWDTALACHALLEAGGQAAKERAERGLQWLQPLQILEVKGDWAAAKPDLQPGGWAFQYHNAFYPDVDDTAVVAMAMDRARGRVSAATVQRYEKAIKRGRDWVEGLQSRNGGWGAFDADNNHDYLNYIPFADHGALLDPPTADVSARCLSLLGQQGETATTSAVVARGLRYLFDTQRSDGSWYGRWGMNYIYGTWSVLCALNAVGVDRGHPSVRKAVEWLLSIQNSDAGWGENGESYKLDYDGYEPFPSTPSQTSWALLGLMAAGEVRHPAVARGIQYLRNTQGEDGFWPEEFFTATGFPRVFYLRYHGYSKFFPLWAVSRYRNLTQGNTEVVLWGM